MKHFTSINKQRKGLEKELETKIKKDRSEKEVEETKVANK